MKLVGTSLSCGIQVRRADVSKMPVYASEEEKALNSPEVVMPSTSGDGAYEESFLDCPQLIVRCLTILLMNELCFRGMGVGGSSKKKKKSHQIVNAAKITLS